MGHFGQKIDFLPWHGWTPGLENESVTLGEVLETLPASEPGEIPEIIRRYENPFLEDGVTPNPDALPGAITLRRHDCIHILVGRGLRVQDEAFVIGYTMGAASDITDEHLATFKHVCVHEYPHPFAFSEEDLISFDLGVGAALRFSPSRDLHLYPFESPENLARTVHDLRREFGLKPSHLRSYFAKEQILRPDTKSSRRLDTTAADDVHLTMPEGECVGPWVKDD